MSFEINIINKLLIIKLILILFYYRSVSRACANLVAPDRLQSEAVDVRMELDLRIGVCFLIISLSLL